VTKVLSLKTTEQKKIVISNLNENKLIEIMFIVELLKLEV
jgi:hypothetical protein